MKKILLVLAVFMCMNIKASVGNSEPILEEVKANYSVGYAIDKSTILGSDMHMWHFEGITPGWYIAYNLDSGKYYYISQEAAQKYTDEHLQEHK